MKIKSFNDEIREHIARMVNEWLAARGRPPMTIDDQTRPAADIEGFDDDAGIAATRQFEEMYRCPFGRNVFLAWKGTRPLSVREMVSDIMNIQAHGC